MTLSKTFLILGGFFLFGIALNMLGRADNATKSKARMYKSKRDFFGMNWIRLLRRTCVDFAMFSWWFFFPATLAKALIAVQVPTWAANWAIVTVNPLSAWGGGIFIDFAWDKLQFKLQRVDSLKWVGEWIGEIAYYDPDVVDVDKMPGQVDDTSKDGK